MTGSVCKPPLAVCKSSRPFCKTRAKAAARIRPKQQTVVGQSKLRVVDKSLTRRVYHRVRRLPVLDQGILTPVLQDRLGLAGADLQGSVGGILQEHRVPVLKKGGRSA